MVLTIDIPEKVVERAASLGVPVDKLVAEAINGIGEEPLPPGFVRLGTSPLNPAQATAMIREIASRHTLGGLKIKDLIEEGRR
jgi:hypothetical protein